MSRRPFLPFLTGACLLIAVLVFSAFPGSTARAQSASVTFRPAADTYVSRSAVGSNYGTKTSLYVDNSPVVRSYLRFTVNGLNGAAVQSAKLRVYANSSNSSGVTVSALSSNSWTENGLTYSNAPVPGSAIKTSGAVSAGSWVEVDISSYVKAEGTYNLVLSTSSTTNTNLAARESGANAPQLVITTGAAAPTATRPAATATQPPAPTATQPAPTQPAPTATRPAPTATSPATSGQPTFPIRAAFYYPWFPEAWNQQSIYPYTNYTPSLGYYSSADQTILKKHIEMMQYGHIQVGIASWWGQGTHTDNKIAGLLTAAAGTPFRWALYHETESQGDPSPSQIQADLTYIRDRYAKDPTFLRINGKFVVFVYAAPNDLCGMADRWKQGNTVGAYVVLKVFEGYRSCASQPDSWHQYSPAVAADSQGSYSYAISPGFWLKGNPVRLARDLNRWTQNVKDMAASRANWQLVTTFSEWGEGTIVEPAKEWASPSGYGQYLDALHNYETLR